MHIYSARSLARMLEVLKGNMVRIGTDLGAKKSASELKALCGKKPAVIILGNEERGISYEVRSNCDELVIIPFAGMTSGAKNSPVDSLNVAQAASIVLYELSK